MTSKNKVYLYNFEKRGGIKKTLRLILDDLKWQTIIDGTKPVYIKLNLSSAKKDTFHYANTDMQVLDALLEIITTRTKDIFLVESDLARGNEQSALYGGGTADEVFKVAKLEQTAKRFGVKLMNLSRVEAEFNIHPLLEDFGLPKCLVNKDKVFITMPIIKTHAITGFTGALKNQWGCVPRWDRLLLHKNLHQLLAIINKKFQPDLVIMGGKYAMEGRGPTNGICRDFPILIGSTKAASADATAMRLIGLEPDDCLHVKLADGSILGNIAADKIEVIGDFEDNKTHFEPASLDWALKTTNYLSRNKFFVYRIMMNQKLFNQGKKIVNLLRKAKIVR